MVQSVVNDQTKKKLSARRKLHFYKKSKSKLDFESKLMNLKLWNGARNLNKN